MIATVIQRLFLMLAAILVALLPLETANAVAGCTPMAAMQADNGDCGGCGDHERQPCQIACLTLCQSLPAASAVSPVPPGISSVSYEALLVSVPPLVTIGPEPPPPRLFR